MMKHSETVTELLINNDRESVFFKKIEFPYQLLYWKLAVVQITMPVLFNFKGSCENNADSKIKEHLNDFL